MRLPGSAARARAAAAARARARRRVIAWAAFAAVVLAAALAERRRRAAHGRALARTPAAPAAPPGTGVAEVGVRRPSLTQLPAGPAVAVAAHTPIIQAADDRDDMGAGRRVPPEEAAVERRDETRTETWIFVRCLIILAVIAATLTVRALYVD